MKSHAKLRMIYLYSWMQMLHTSVGPPVRVWFRIAPPDGAAVPHTVVLIHYSMFIFLTIKC